MARSQPGQLVGNAAQSPPPSLMKAWRVHEFGPPEVMILEMVPRPDPDPGEILVKVHAAGVGPWDGWIRAGRSALPQPLPLTLGADLSGEAAALGFQHFQHGRRRPGFRCDQHSIPWRLRGVRGRVGCDDREEAKLAQLC